MSGRGPVPGPPSVVNRGREGPGGLKCPALLQVARRRRPLQFAGPTPALALNRAAVRLCAPYALARTRTSLTEAPRSPNMLVPSQQKRLNKINKNPENRKKVRLDCDPGRHFPCRNLGSRLVLTLLSHGAAAGPQPQLRLTDWHWQCAVSGASSYCASGTH